MNDEMDGRDPEWTAMEAEWKAGMESVAAARGELRRVGRGFRSLPGWAMAAAAVSAAVFAASLWILLERSEAAYTFGVILWSAYFALGGFWVSTREPADEAAQAVAQALDRRARRLERSSAWLEFARTLLGVESILCAVFWLVLERERGGAGPMAAGFLLAGVLGYGGLTQRLRAVRREREGLDAMAEEMGRGA
jgi:hypothetical protein